MLRPGAMSDVDAVMEICEEHFTYETAHTAWTIFKRGVYPTRDGMEQAARTGSLFVCEEDGCLAGFVCMNQHQPPEYANVSWSARVQESEVLVIHLIIVRPAMYRHGVASAILRYAAELARAKGCRVLRLDTGGQNIPAVTLYQKNGFRIAGHGSMDVGGAISHSDHLFLEKPLD